MSAELQAVPRRGGRRTATVVGIVLAAGALVAGGIVAGRHGGGGDGGAPVAQLTTAEVVRTDLTSTTQVPGTLGFAGAVTVIGQTAGAQFTWLPTPGAVIRRGKRLYEVDGRAVPLLFGQRPEWRTLSNGVLPGPDVAQLEANLVRLGYADGSLLTIDRHFTWQTAAALRRWQTARGATATGTLAPGDVVYAPGPVRVKTVAAKLGSTPQPGQPLIDATTTVRQVSAPLPVTLQHLVHEGDAVSVTLPDGSSTARGVVAAVGHVASAASSGNQGQGGGQSPGGEAPATVTLRVRLFNPRAGGAVDAAPVTVNITSERARHVLAVPVSALVALAGGGYAVEVIDGSARRLVSVQTGLFANTRVQVSGAGLSSGTRVQVPAP
ncbi:MAG: Peptidoglycan-binding domain 1 protein [Solirubrobacterales bacterium]|nr:Peptidoglycan-binding domain 1 protein [Solirubrobacterales bacterium]